MQFRAKKDIFWDNWGRIVCVVRKGQITTGELIPNFNPSRPWEYCWIESTNYPGITDYASAEEVEAI